MSVFMSMPYSVLYCCFVITLRLRRYEFFIFVLFAPDCLAMVHTFYIILWSVVPTLQKKVFVGILKIQTIFIAVLGSQKNCFESTVFFTSPYMHSLPDHYDPPQELTSTHHYDPKSLVYIWVHSLCLLRFDRNGIESEDHYGKYCYFNHVKPSIPWAKEVFPLIQVFLSFSDIF